MKKILIVFLLIIISILNCGRKISIKKWEGIRENKMRVYISDFCRDDDMGEIRERFKILSKERAMLILASHATFYIVKSQVSENSDRELNDAISRSLQVERVLYFNCTDSNYCESVSEFNISSYLKTLDKINSN